MVLSSPSKPRKHLASNQIQPHNQEPSKRKKGKNRNQGKGGNVNNFGGNSNANQRGMQPKQGCTLKRLCVIHEKDYYANMCHDLVKIDS
jgi:hypothetical protein